MKKYIFLFLIITGIISAQSNVHLSIDANTGKPMLIGKIERQALLDSNFSTWFNKQYNFYKPDTKIENELIPQLKNKKIEIVMGTWCSDSRREVPRFLKVLDKANFPDSSLEIITINRKLKSINTEVDSLGIERVPTIIVFENGKELGRIIETPIETLEKDLKQILDKNELKKKH